MSTVLSTSEIEKVNNLLAEDSRLSPRSFTREGDTNNSGEMETYSMTILRCGQCATYLEIVHDNATS